MAKLDIKNLAGALYEATEGKSGEEQKKIIHAALVMLAKNGMAGKADDLVEEFQKIDDTRHGVARAEVLSRKKLTEKEHHEIVHFLKHKHKAEHVVMDEKIDESVLGGVKIKVGDTLYDGTLKTKLNQLQMHLTN